MTRLTKMISIESKYVRMMKIYCNVWDKYRKLKNCKISNIFEKTALSTAFTSLVGIPIGIWILQ